MEKQALRARMRASRDALPASAREAKSAEITRRLTQLPVFQSAAVVFAYVSIGSEVGTTGIIAEAVRSGKAVAIPKVVSGQRLLACCLEVPLDHLRPGFAGIPEPDLCTPVPPERIDLVIVPGLAFDPAGNRLGYGRGFYDGFLRCLRGVRPDAATVGLAFAAQVVTSVPTDPWDVPVGFVVTESLLINCANNS